MALLYGYFCMALRAKFLGANLKIRRVHAASPHL
jgi:hypothetical protein